MKKPEELENRAANPHDPKGTEEVLADMNRMKGKTQMDTTELAARVAAGRAIAIPGAVQLHCQHCFGEGREAACRAIENWKPED